MGGIKKDSAQAAIQSFKTWHDNVQTYMDTIPGLVSERVSKSVGYSAELKAFVDHVVELVNTELLAKIQLTVDALDSSINGTEHGVSATHEKIKGDVTEKKDKIAFSADQDGE